MQVWRMAGPVQRLNDKHTFRLRAPLWRVSTYSFLALERLLYLKKSDKNKMY